MKKFAVFSGFLGSGKTTTMMALTDYHTARHGKAAMISNDLGHGVNLADNRFAQLSGCNASEMTDECICYQNENLAERLNSYYDDGCELVISDIPGFGVGALEHVYHGLTEKFPGQYELAPFTVLVEPRTVELLRSGAAGDLRYLYDTQLVEADLIVLNKCDLISGEQRQADADWLREHYPQARVICISALRQEGLEELSQALTGGEASLRRPDIGYGGADFMFAMGKISEYYFQYLATVCCNDFDGDAYLLEIAREVQEKIAAAGYEIPHLKLLAWEPEGDFGKVDLLGTGREIEINHRFTRPCTSLAVVVNASAACPADQLNELVTAAVREVSERYQLELMVHKQECFGMTD
ncbi:MAG: hypothetical protein IK116_07510 [Firmicutes bacterium]|nr:hypothetical protein [Bacillota bacterium]